MFRIPVITEPILIVEDDPDDQFLFRKVFERLSIEAELIFFSNGREAFQYLKTTERKTFLIFCDINMPVMNGLEFRARICDDEHLRRKSIPFIFLSTAASRAEIESAYDLSVQGFFQKENCLEDMENMVEMVVAYWSKSKHPNKLAQKE